MRHCAKGADFADMKPLRTLFLLTALSLFAFLPAAAAPSPATTNEFAALAQRLVEDGLDPAMINDLFSREEVFFNPDGVSLFFIHSESSLNYDQFTTDRSIGQAREYMASHQDALDRAQEEYGVDKTVITAIILVETRLGNYLGRRTVINTLSTMAALSTKELQDRIWDAIPDNKKPDRESFDQKVKTRSKWGYQELKALIRYALREGLDPAAIKGSYAGAMGIPQFMPSNALTLAKDGTGDGKVDLFDHADAIFSVANFLAHHGWKPGISRQRQHQVLFRYNRSNYYVDTLLKVSDKLK